MDEDRNGATPGFWTSPSGLTLLVALAAAGFYMITEHTAHVLGIAPYLFILACPLMHIFMHHGHGRGHDAHGGVEPGSAKDEQRR